jgi:hypothetical protein
LLEGARVAKVEEVEDACEVRGGVEGKERGGVSVGGEKEGND